MGRHARDRSIVAVVRELGLAVTFTDLNFPSVEKKFDEQGKLLDDASRSELKIF